MSAEVLIGDRPIAVDRDPAYESGTAVLIGSWAVSPSEARRLALRLLAAADEAESHSRVAATSSEGRTS